MMRTAQDVLDYLNQQYAEWASRQGDDDINSRAYWGSVSLGATIVHIRDCIDAAKEQDAENHVAGKSHTGE